MAGFFGLFNSKTKYVDESGKGNEPETPNNSEAYYLNSDDAKTYGNIEFMRKQIAIKKTFPKTVGNQVTEVINQVSSMEKGKKSSANGSATPEFGKTTENNSTDTQRRKGDSSLDMFRNMARDIRK